MIARRLVIGSLLFLMGLLAGRNVAFLQEPTQGDLLPETILQVAHKIEPILLKQALQEKTPSLRFIVFLREEADLSLPCPLCPQGQRLQSVVAQLQKTAQRSQAHLLADLAGYQATGHVRSFSSLWIANAIAVIGDRHALTAAAARPEVAMVRLDRKRRWIETPLVSNPEIWRWIKPWGLLDPPGNPMPRPTGTQAVEWNIQKIGADAAWATLGLDGNGVVVANMDTGVDWQHPALMQQYRGYNPHGLPRHAGNWFDATQQGYTYPGDGHGHGTHTMGTLVGRNGIGVAPGARWIAVKVFDNWGSAYDSWIHAGFQWLLAPDGDPSLAPQVVSNSWGDENSLSETFRRDLLAWRAAGIFSVFSAGNSGPNQGTINSPASLPEAFSAGATDANDLIAYFSSRGPSPWGQVKPEVTAPGISIRSSLPGGAYGVMNGTSMAAPHVAGVAALLLQARPGMDITTTAYLITNTALPLRSTPNDPIPNNTYGWGRLDALAAVRLAVNAGLLQGTVRNQDGSPVPNATVIAVAEVGPYQGKATTDSSGNYSLYLSPGAYGVTAGAFGYQTAGPVRVNIVAGQSTTKDFTLTLMPWGIVTGFVLERGTSLPLSATITALDTPRTTVADPATGAYSLTLPAGHYTLRATAWSHRTITQTVDISENTTTVADLLLPPGPNILLVDSGTWYNDSHAARYQADLDALGYFYATRPITASREPPTATELLPYDLVIWSSPQDSPGFTGGDNALRAYLDADGRSLLSGQDIGYWDGGGSGYLFASYFEKYLHARYVADSAPTNILHATPDGPFAGITLTLNSADSDRNQQFPDVIAPADAQADPNLNYADDGMAGLSAEVCLPYRVIYLGFGLEGAGPQAQRRALLERAINRLMSPWPEREVRLAPANQTHIGMMGGAVTGTVTIWNTGRLTDTYRISLGPSPWPATLWDDLFRSPSTGTVTLAACDSISVGIAISIPYSVTRNITATTAINVSSTTDPTVGQAITFSAKTPAPLLLVDDDRWYEVEDAYKDALAADDQTYDIWDTRGGTTPVYETLQMYPAVIWFTGYDWYQPLTAADEQALARYLDGGGRLFLSAQDYLFVSGLTDFGNRYLGVLTYTNDITAVAVTGASGNPIGEGLGPYTLTLPYREWADIVTPTAAASIAFLNANGDPTALTLDGGAFKTVFFSFPFEGLPAAGRSAVLRRIIRWFDPLAASTFSVDRSRAAPGDTLSYALILSNPGTEPAPVQVTNTLPAALTLLPETLQNATYHEASRTILWEGTLSSGEERTITYRARLDPGFRGRLRNIAMIKHASYSPLQRIANTLVPYVYYLPLIAGGSRD